MTNKDISNSLKLLGKLKEVHGENAFKTKAYASASFQVSKLTRPLVEMTDQEITSLTVFGKSIANKIIQAIQVGTFEELDQYVLATPTGVLDLLELKGLGASKVKVLWREHRVDELSKLEQLCLKNELSKFKGFAEKTQQSILQAIAFKKKNQGKLLFAQAELYAQQIISVLKDDFAISMRLTGAMARKDQVIDCIELLTCESLSQQARDYIVRFQQQLEVKLLVDQVLSDQIDYECFVRTCSKEHLSALNIDKKSFDLENVYQKNNLPFIIPEMRNNPEAFDWARHYTEDEIVNYSDLKGALHNHSTFSDGAHTIEQMAQGCKDLGLEYFGIADHSKTAVYANGLSEQRLKDQFDQIDQINQKGDLVYVLKGIESDILSDGSLDYDDGILDQFEYVVASVHQGLNMNEQRATSRLIKAIEHPSTSILGHLSGRLLLKRKSYPLDYDKVVDACIANQVAIEINANPWRLDIDWMYIYKAMQKGAFFSINPDAHKIEGLPDMKYGVYSARKAGLLKERVINTFDLSKLKNFFQKKGFNTL